jgi:predicted transcriptional regulator
MPDNNNIALTARLVAAFVKNNKVAVGDVIDLINTTYATVAGLSAPPAPVAEPLQPAVPIKKSITAEAVICLECGKPHKTLKRHLTTSHDLTVDEYRAKWSLPADYPMVAPNYAERRSQMAVTIGLGRKRPAETDEPKSDDPAPRHRYPASRWSKPGV